MRRTGLAVRTSPYPRASAKGRIRRAPVERGGREVVRLREWLSFGESSLPHKLHHIRSRTRTGTYLHACHSGSNPEAPHSGAHAHQ